MGARSEGPTRAAPCSAQSPAAETVLEANCALISGGALAVTSGAVW